MSSRLSLKIVLACVVQLIECAGLEINQHGSQVWVLSQVLNAGVEGSSPSRVTNTKLFDIINMGQRRSWRGGTDCNNRVNCIKSQIGNMLEVSEYHTLLQSQSVVVRLSRFDSYLTHSRHISTYMNQQTIYPLQRWWCWDWNMGRDALKLGMIQRMILYCARILYLKCIFGTKSRFGRSFPHMLANKNPI